MTRDLLKSLGIACLAVPVASLLSLCVLYAFLAAVASGSCWRQNARQGV